MLLIAPTYSLNEIVERPALALSFPHDELRRVQFHHIELQPLAARCELNGQAFTGRDKSKMLRQGEHRLAALKLAAATHIRPGFASFQRDIHDFLIGVGRMRLHKGFGACCREVARHLDITIKPSGQAALTVSVDGDATGALAEDSGVALTESMDGDATSAPAEDASVALSLTEDADVTATESMDAEATGALAKGTGVTLTESMNPDLTGALAEDAGVTLTVSMDADATGALAEDAGITLTVSIDADTCFTSTIHPSSRDTLAIHPAVDLTEPMHPDTIITRATYPYTRICSSRSGTDATHPNWATSLNSNLVAGNVSANSNICPMGLESNDCWT